MTKPTVILDKSYLQGSKSEDIRSLCQTHLVLMPDVLFYELLSTDEATRSRCFQKFPVVDDPVILAPNVSTLLSHEIATHTPCGAPSNWRVDFSYRFNPGLMDPAYRLEPETQAFLEKQNVETKNDVAEFAERVRVTASLFPDVCTGRDDRREAAKTEAEKTISTDPSAVVAFYRQLETPDGEKPFPPADLVTPSWAIFRWLQANLLIALDLCWRYGARLPDPLVSKGVYQKIEHDMLDSHYVILGALENALATNDHTVMRFWSLMCPNGRIFSLGKESRVTPP